MPIPLDELSKANGAYRDSPDSGASAKAGWSDLGGAAMDSTEAGLYGVGEALGIPGARRRRIENQNQAQETQQWAEPQLGIARSFDEAQGVGGTARYLAGQVVNMAPQVAGTIGAGLATGGLGAGAAAYGFALSDTLQNQREQSGDTDLMSAAAAAAPYAAVDVLTGGEGRLLRAAGVKGLERQAAEAPSRFNLLGRAEHAATQYADDLTGAKGVAARTGLAFGKTGAEEAAGETFQETMNQAARMGVDPDATFTSGDALERYKESAIVGGLIGGGIGSATGGWRRSPGYERAAPVGGPQSGQSVLGDKAEIQAPTDTSAVTPGSVADPARGVGNDAALAPQVNKIIQDKMVGPAEAAIAMQGEANAPPTPEAQAAQQEALDMRERRAKDEATNARGEALGVDMNKHGLLFTTLEEAGLPKEVFDRAVDYLASGQNDKIKMVKDGIEQFTRERAAKEQADLQARAAETASKEQSDKLANTAALMGGIRNAKGQVISGLAKDRLLMMLGLDEDGSPVGDRYTADEVAQIESGVQDTAKPVTKQAIDGMLKQYGLDEKAIDALYERIHGTGQTQQVFTEGAGENENVSLEAPEGERGPTDTDQSGDLDAGVDTAEMGEAGSMSNVASIKKNIAVERNKKSLRNDAFKSLMGRGFNDEQKAAIEAARKADSPEALQKADKLFSEDERAAFKIMFEHGDATAAAARQPAIQAEIDRRRGVLTEHQKQVRQRQAIANMAQREREEQARVEAEALKEGDLANADERLEEDARTLRMHLMDNNKVRQARLIGESLADAKASWDELVTKFSSRPPEFQLPPWAELTPREQASFVRVTDWANYESAEKGVSDLEAQTKVEARADELAEEAGERKAEAAKREAKAAKAAAPEFQQDVQEKAAAEAAAEAKRVTDEARARAQERADAAAAKKKEKEDANKQGASAKGARRRVTKAEAVQGDGGRAGGAPRQEVERGGPAAAGEEVPQGGARGAADATARAPHGPGSVRGADGQAAPAGGNVVAQDGQGVRPADAATGGELVGGVRPTILPYMGDRHTQPDAEPDAEEESGILMSIERLDAARRDSPSPLTVTPAAGVQVEGGAPRMPSVTRVVRRSKKGLEQGKMTAEQFAAQSSAALDAADAARAAKVPNPRLRGADRIMEVLLAARRNGELDAQGVEMALWFIRQNPQAVGNLAVSVKKAEEGQEGASGTYDPVTRIVTLMKGSKNPETAVHEILHHLERMMPAPLQNAIRRAWTKSIAKAYEGALKAGNTDLAHYYKLLTDYHFDGGDPKALEQALDMMHAGHVGYEHYQNFNPSEFWAVNGSRIVQGRFGVSGSILGRIKQYLKEFVQKAKSVLGLQSDAAVIRALDSMASADGNFTTGMMLQDQPGVHFMYAGEKTQDQEALSQLQMYGFMRSGDSDATKVRLATGWFRSPLDQEMRYEFSDADAEFTSLRPPERMEVASYYEEPTTYRLEDVLDHPALYEAYPDAKDIKVTRQASNEDGGRRVQGWFNPDNNLVNITPYAQNPLSTIIHELQHWVQVKEGWTVGGSPEEVTKAMSLPQRERLFAAIQKEIADPDFKSTLDPKDQQLLIDKIAADGDPDALAMLGAGTDALLRAYKHIAGEIEARDTQARLGMSMRERLETAPLKSEADKIAMKDVVRFRQPAAGNMGSYLNVERPVEQRLSTFDAAVDKSTKGLPPKAARHVKSYTNTMRGAAKTVNNWITFTPDIIRKALAGMPSAKAYMDAMQRSDVRRRGRMELVANVRDDFARLTLGERTAVNKYMYDSTMGGNWGFQPAHLTNEVKVDPDMARQFKALSKEAQQNVRDQFAHNHSDLVAMKAAVIESVNEEYDASILRFEEAGEKDRADQTREKKASALAAYDKLMSIRSDTPYAPLKRFGNFVVVAKSQAYMDAEEAGDTKAMTALETDPAHYRVEMRETRGEAKVLSDELAEQFPDGITEHFAKDSTYDSLGTAQMMAGFARLQRQSGDAGDKVSAATQAQLKRMMTDLYYSMLAESSARQSEQRRKGIAGADTDMMRAFSTKGQANANFISMLENNGKAQTALTNMRKEAHRSGAQNGTTREERADHYNEILKRHSMGMDWRPTPNIDRLLHASSYWTLLSSPASWLVNATQTMAISVPVMGGRHGPKAMFEATKSYKELSKPLWDAFKKGDLDTEAILKIADKVGLRDEIAKLIASGHISGETNFDLQRSTSFDYDGPGGALKKINNKFEDVSQAVELLNRLTTAVTAIRLEKARDAKTDGTAYAANIIYTTHGDYSGFAAPAWMRTPVGRVLGQFRKFQLIQLGMYARLFKSAFDSGLTNEERWAARKSLGWLFTSMGLWGGALGMPGAQVIGAVIGAVFGDDDEPDNQEQTMRKLIGNEDVADMLLQGLPSGLLGINLSGRVGAGSLGNPLPFGKMALDKESVTTNVVAALGPMVGTAIKGVDGINTMVTGDFWRGVENFMPKGFGNAVKGADMLVRGVQQKNGDTVMSADEIGVFDAFMQGIGMPTTKITDRGFRSNYAYESKQFYNQNTTAVKQAYVQAYKSGDSEAMAEARERWGELNAAKKANGYKPSPLSDLIKAPREQAKRERNTAGGVQYRSREEGAIRQLAEL